jgi:hypothetical protein
VGQDTKFETEEYLVSCLCKGNACLHQQITMIVTRL